MKATSVLSRRICPTVQVLPNPTLSSPRSYAVVSTVVLPTYAGHWAPAGANHAGMWVMTFATELDALAAAERLRLLGHAQ